MENNIIKKPIEGLESDLIYKLSGQMGQSDTNEIYIIEAQRK
jgi:hypothetical protein